MNHYFLYFLHRKCIETCADIWDNSFPSKIVKLSTFVASEVISHVKIDIFFVKFNKNWFPQKLAGYFQKKFSLRFFVYFLATISGLGKLKFQKKFKISPPYFVVGRVFENRCSNSHRPNTILIGYFYLHALYNILSNCIRFLDLENIYLDTKIIYIRYLEAKI